MIQNAPRPRRRYVRRRFRLDSDEFARAFLTRCTRGWGVKGAARRPCLGPVSRPMSVDTNESEEPCAVGDSRPAEARAIPKRRNCLPTTGMGGEPTLDAFTLLAADIEGWLHEYDQKRQ